MQLSFKSVKYANLRIALPYSPPPRDFVQFKENRYSTDDPEIIRLLLANPSYGTAFVNEEGYYIVDVDNTVVNVMDSRIADKKRYPSNLSQEVSIIIGTHNNPQCINNCLASLFKYTPKGFEVIVVANQTDGVSLKTLMDYSHNHKDCMKLLVNSVNKGFSEFNNQAVKESTKPYIVFLNDDTILRSLWLESMVYIMKTITNCGIVGKRTHHLDNKPFHHCETFVSGETEVVYGHCILVKKEDAWFDAKTYPGYGWEDIDLCMRLKKAGKKIMVERRFPIIHIGSVSTNKIEDKIADFGVNQRNYNIKWRVNQTQGEPKTLA